jgi:hypothetical protein
MYIFRETPRGLLAVFQEEDDSPVKVETVEEFLAGLSTKTSPLQPEQPPEPPKKRTVTEASSLIDILAIAVQFHSDFELFFPNVELPEQEKLQLYNWTQDKPGVAWDFIDHGEGGVTLTKQEVSDDIIWKPPVRENGSEYPL